jgi:hypothetical protein
LAGNVRLLLCAQEVGSLNGRQETKMAKATGGGGGQRSGGGGGGGHRGGSSPDRSPNDDRSDVKNPNNQDYEYDRVNQEKQSGGG